MGGEQISMGDGGAPGERWQDKRSTRADRWAQVRQAGEQVGPGDALPQESGTYVRWDRWAVERVMAEKDTDIKEV